jgi:hypothetical protein
MASRSVLSPGDIATERQVVHPALDWRDETLMMGVLFGTGGRGVITSKKQILNLSDLPWPICDRARNFSRSPVTARIADLLRSSYGNPSDSEHAYDLVNVPSRLAAYDRRFVVFSTGWWPEVLALWTLGTYLYPIFSAYPYLRITCLNPDAGSHCSVK